MAAHSAAASRLQALHDIGEHMAAGYLELPTAAPVVKAARALRRHFELGELPEWRGEPLYPCGNAALVPHNGLALAFSYTFGLTLDGPLLRHKMEQHGNDRTGKALALLREAAGELHVPGSVIPDKYCVGGAGFTHSIVNYGRAVREGLSSYGQRLRDASAGASPQGGEFCRAMEDLLVGIRTLQRRCADRVSSLATTAAAVPGTGDRLASALARVPLQPARSFREAMVAVNLLWYLDGSDSLGRFDQDLGPYLEADLASGAITRQDALELVRLLWRNVDDCSGWNAAIGGSNHDGSAAYSVLTELCLEAAVGRRRPNLALLVAPSMPDTIWGLALDSLASGCGLPALYNEEAYLAGVQDAYDCTGNDSHRVAFGGCTETMVHGCSNVGSIDAGVNLAAIMEGTLRDHLRTAASYEELESEFLDDARAEIAEAARCISADQEAKARRQPQPIRSLLVDDCIDRAEEYNAGGARYNGSVFNVAGLANVADSLCAVKRLVFRDGVSAQSLHQALASDFAGSPDLLHAVRACPRFGNDDDEVDAIAVRVATALFAAVKSHRAWRGDRPLLPACIMFVTYGWVGASVGATPDGRLAGEPVADSIGPYQGRDRNGPTAMLRSVSKLPLQEAIGTPVLNIRLSAEFFSEETQRQKLKALIRTYFSMGGMQLQVTVVDQAVLCDAMEHPERHQNLIVRIGGYSEYFSNLTPELRRAVLARTEHGM